MLGHEQRYLVFMRLPRFLRLWIKGFYERLSTIFYIVRFSLKREKGLRILGVVDFNEEGFGLGDGLVFQVFLNILMIDHKAVKVDTCYIDDPTHINAKREAYRRSLYLKRILSTVHEFNPNTGSHFHFDSNAQFADFISKLRNKYIVWPILYSSFTHRRLYDTKVIIDFHKKNGYLPSLTCKQELINWAHDFCAAHIGSACSVVVHLRVNPTRRSVKNSNIEAWNRFFVHHEHDTSLKFIIIGTKEEIIPKFREYQNILFSKDFDTSLEQDLALMQIAYISLCSASGPGILPRFAGLPTLTFGLNPLYTTDIPYGGTYPFLNKYQKLFWGVETFESIENEFGRLMEALKKDGWENPYKYKAIEKPKHNF